MYIPGRSLTGSRPLRTVMSLASYATREPSDRRRVWEAPYQGKVLVRALKSNVVILPDRALRAAPKWGVPPLVEGFLTDRQRDRRAEARAVGNDDVTGPNGKHSSLIGRCSVDLPDNAAVGAGEAHRQVVETEEIAAGD